MDIWGCVPRHRDVRDCVGTCHAVKVSVVIWGHVPCRQVSVVVWGHVPCRCVCVVHRVDMYHAVKVAVVVWGHVPCRWVSMVHGMDVCHADGCAWSYRGHACTCSSGGHVPRRRVCVVTWGHVPHRGGCVVTRDAPSGVRGCTGTCHAVGVSLLTMPCRRGGRATSERHRGRDVTSVSPPKKPRLTFATVTSPNTQ